MTLVYDYQNFLVLIGLDFRGFYNRSGCNPRFEIVPLPSGIRFGSGLRLLLILWALYRNFEGAFVQRRSQRPEQ